jgi:hypothetical protein
MFVWYISIVGEEEISEEGRNKKDRERKKVD